MKDYPIAPELKKYCRNIPFSPFMLVLSAPVLKVLYALTPIEKGVTHEKRLITANGKKLRLDVFSPKGCRNDAPVLFYLHGGGFGYSASPFHKKLAAIYAKEVPCRVVCPDYSLLPFHPFPCAKNECLEAYEQVRKMFSQSRFAVGGDSAGGALAIHVVNESKVNPCFQLLLYPVCDPAQRTGSMKKFTDTPFWNAVNNKKMWKMYCANHTQSEVSPLETLPSSGVPDAYIEVAEIDCLHDEGVLYSEALKKSGAAVLLNETKGAVHGYDTALSTNIVKESIQKRIEALKKAFNHEV